MNCPDDKMIGMLLDGTLRDEQAAELSEHIQTCAHCRKIRDELAHIDDLAKSSFYTNMEQQYLDELKEKIKERDKGKQGYAPARIYRIAGELFWFATQAAAIFLVAFAVGFILFAGRAPVMGSGRAGGFGLRMAPHIEAHAEKPIVDILREKDRAVARLL